MNRIFAALLLCLFSSGSFGQALEIPAPLKSSAEKIVRHKAYTLSFNEKTNLPNWVAWQLTEAKVTVAKVKRSNEFLPDPLVSERHRVDGYALRGSGYERGHMCPAGDNKWDADAMIESFYMSNICPQTHELNGTWWEHLESACRRWAEQEGCVYIVCGPLYRSGKPGTVGNDIQVAVPDAFFKVVLSTRKGHEKAIGFYFTNDSARQPMGNAACSVDAIEKMTGMDFFPSLDDKIEKKVEAAFNLNAWN